MRKNVRIKLYRGHMNQRINEKPDRIRSTAHSLEAPSDEPLFDPRVGVPVEWHTKVMKVLAKGN